MITIKEEVRSALSELELPLVYGYPRCFVRLPLVAWRESLNQRHAQADGREHLAELNYTLEIFAPDSESADAILAAADERLRSLGLRREHAAEQYETDAAVSHITARYRCLADGAGRIFQ